MSNPQKGGRFQNLRTIRNAEEVPLEAPTSLVPDQTEPAPLQEVPRIPTGVELVDRTMNSSGKRARAELAEEERAGGKRSNPAFMQISAFVERDVHLDAGDKLRAQNRAKPRENWRDLSDVINALLAGWLTDRFSV